MGFYANWSHIKKNKRKVPTSARNAKSRIVRTLVKDAKKVIIGLIKRVGE